MSGKLFFIILAVIFQAKCQDYNNLFDLGDWGNDFPNCRKDVEILRDGINNHEIWAYQMLDSSTKIPNGILTGNLIDYGNYDECLSVTWSNGSDGFVGQHCVASLTLNSSSFLQLIASNSSLDAALVFQWSYCIPNSCPAGVLEANLNKFLEKFNVTATVSQENCHTNEVKSLSASDITGMVICAFFGVIALSSTIYDIICRHISIEPNAWLISFSIYTNGEKLLSTKTAAGTMKPLNGLRFLSIVWIILAHRYFFLSSTAMNLFELTQEFEKLSLQLLTGAVLAVDTFFLLSGLLNAYNLLNILDKTNKFPGIMFYVHRYLRTTPALAAIVLMYATWYVLLGDGPAWDKTTFYGKQYCVDNWWPTLLYINNYYNPVSQCAGQSWYLAVDMQLYWLSPLIVIPLWKWPKFGRYYLLILLILSILTQFVIAYVFKFRMAYSISQNMEEYKKATELIYVPTHTRATPYIIGIMLGYYLNEMKKLNGKLKMSKLSVIAGWLISTTLCLTVILGNYPFFASIENHPYNRLESSFFIGFHRLAWSIGISWIILACLYGYGGLVNTILSWKIFVPLGRLTYCIFLTHLAVQQYQLGTMRTPEYYTQFNQIHRFFGDLVTSLIASVILSLLFESPVVVLEKLIFKKPVKGTKKTLEWQENKAFEEDKQSFRL